MNAQMDPAKFSKMMQQFSMANEKMETASEIQGEPIVFEPCVMLVYRSKGASQPAEAPPARIIVDGGFVSCVISMSSIMTGQSGYDSQASIIRYCLG